MIARICSAFAILSTLVSALVVSGCGYGFQGAHSELLEKEGVKRVFVAPLTNNTYKPGVENTVYNALVRTLLAHRRVSIVSNEKESDAVLSGVISIAQFGASGSTLAESIGSKGLTDAQSQIQVQKGTISVATIYSASLSCSFSLSRRKPPPGKRGLIWSGGFSRSKTFPSANQLDVPGTTSTLINESEFERALGELAVMMMDDLHEQMLAMF